VIYFIWILQSIGKVILKLFPSVPNDLQVIGFLFAKNVRHGRAQRQAVTPLWDPMGLVFPGTHAINYVCKYSVYIYTYVRHQRTVMVEWLLRCSSQYDLQCCASANLVVEPPTAQGNWGSFQVRSTNHLFPLGYQAYELPQWFNDLQCTSCCNKNHTDNGRACLHA